MKDKNRIKSNEYLNKTTESKALNLISKLISAAFLILYFVSIIVFKNANVLPTKYLIILTIALVAISGSFFFLQFFKSIKKKTRIILDIISVLFIAILSIGVNYCLKLDNFLDNITNSDYEIQNYSVIVLNNNTYNKLSDLNGKTMGYINNEDTNIDSIKNELNSSVNPTYVAYEDISELRDSLLSKDVDSIVIEDSQKAILEEEAADFFEKAKVIYTFSIKSTVESISKEAMVSSEPFNIYISGIDTYGDIGTVSRSDVNIIVTVNPNTKQILLTNIPRDSYIKLHGTTGYKDKLTHAGIYGIDMSVKTIEDLLGIDINYYFKVNFSSVESIVNTLDGITAYSKYAFTSYIGNYHFVSGYNNMNGAQALAFARERKAFAEGDIMRGQNQQSVIEAIIRKASTPSIITKYSTLLNSLSGKFQTNMPTDKITELIKYQISTGSKWTVTSITLDGNGSSQYTYSYSKQKLSVVILNQDSVDNAKEKIASVLGGTKLDSSYTEVKNATDTTQAPTKNNNTNTNTGNNTTSNNNNIIIDEEENNKPNNENTNVENPGNTNENDNDNNNDNDNDNDNDVDIYQN